MEKFFSVILFEMPIYIDIAFEPLLLGNDYITYSVPRGAIILQIVLGPDRFLFKHFLLQGTSEEWRNVFYICTVLNILGIIVFSSMSTGEVQPWSRTTIELIIAPGIKDTESQTKHDQNYGLNDDSKDKDGVEDVLIERKALLMRNIEYS